MGARGFVPLAVAGAVALVLTGAKGAGSSAERVTLEVAGVLPMPQGPAGLLILRDHGTGTILPLLVPDGAAVGAATKGGRGPPDLLGRTLDALGARVREVEIARAEETTGGARVRISQAGHDIELPARPSESVALAVAAGAPIVTTRRILAESGLTPGEMHDALRGGGGANAHGAPLRL
jgi:bifunctional DNase/RNase